MPAFELYPFVVAVCEAEAAAFRRARSRAFHPTKDDDTKAQIFLQRICNEERFIKIVVVNERRLGPFAVLARAHACSKKAPVVTAGPREAQR